MKQQQHKPQNERVIKTPLSGEKSPVQPKETQGLKLYEQASANFNTVMSRAVPQLPPM